MSSPVKILMSALALSLAALSAQAQPTRRGDAAAATPRVDTRQAHQQARIHRGVSSGALTPREQHRLQHQQQHIARAEAHAKADGRVTAQERQRLTQLQDRASRDIRRQKHDDQTRRAG
jgi:hypothetical protein